MGHRLRLIIRLLLLVTAAYLAVTMAIVAMFWLIWPEYYFTWFPVIPVFFWVMGLGLAFSLEYTHSEKPDAVTMTYMIARGVKLLLTAVFLGLYVWLVGVDKKQFGLTTLGFYLVFMVLETYMFFLYEKRKAKRSGKLKTKSEIESAMRDSQTDKEDEVDA